ncbi:Adenosine/AMP deaminase domain protein [Kalmanozyma brasiliensis GHG001]|uniref:Adenosine deaminase domain-containing protein n=1 Tax=Kalmanozyma brasiliensis (strain GHG001) TaxID=1365824 RepID=V5EW58_KALBG|nr:Adenosine/AMP deaminase domain protein [Kalmanozyma brasiliensis GHG001]EST06519.1 Adenosine/AMP deaminase domain protein [Kalmanozyma brasiliensis GHG001]
MSMEADPSARRARFVRDLPKLELHAHLNGSIRRSTLLSLAASHGIDPSSAQILTRWPSTLSEAFSVFTVIHSCVTTLSDVERIAFEVGEDMASDGVVYAEIRSTPRAMEGGSLDDYVRAVLRGFGRYRLTSGVEGVVLRLILSIDRAKHTAADAQDIVDLATAHRLAGVVGIDLSGDPTKGEFLTFLPALQRARSLGLKITLHAGEVANTDTEMSAMLDFHPDRFGHCCFVSDDNLKRLTQSRVPIELCLTSNLLSNSVGSAEEHHFGLHHANGTVCCISTDDSGVFGSPLSNEFALVMDAFALDERQAFELAKRTLEAVFLPTSDPGTEATEEERRDWSVRQRVRAAFDAFHRTWDWE